ncbi:hypothetical protein ACFC1I_11410 [Microbacterium sp. NPDC056044]
MTSLQLLGGADDADMCGPDGCTIPVGHPALAVPPHGEDASPTPAH